MYILIILFHINADANGMAQEFSSQRTCEAAKTEVLKANLSGTNKVLCVHK
jgi:hypothetical protein